MHAFRACPGLGVGNGTAMAKSCLINCVLHFSCNRNGEVNVMNEIWNLNVDLDKKRLKNMFPKRECDKNAFL